MLCLSAKTLVTNAETVLVKSAAESTAVPLASHHYFIAVVTNANTTVERPLVGSTKTSCPPLVIGCPAPVSEKASVTDDSVSLTRSVFTFLTTEGSIPYVLSLSSSFLVFALISLFTGTIVVFSAHPPVVVLPTGGCWVIVCSVLLAVLPSTTFR